jgi:hypothetical protein
MNVGSAGLAVGLLGLVAGLVLIFATGGLGIPIGVALIVAVLAGIAAQAARSSRSSRSAEEADPTTRRPGEPVQNENDKTAFVGTDSPSDPLRH